MPVDVRDPSSLRQPDADLSSMKVRLVPSSPPLTQLEDDAILHQAHPHRLPEFAAIWCGRRDLLQVSILLLSWWLGGGVGGGRTTVAAGGGGTTVAAVGGGTAVAVGPGYGFFVFLFF
jgi:hypothetical protein